MDGECAILLTSSSSSSSAAATVLAAMGEVCVAAVAPCWALAGLVGLQYGQ
jgi:hypothetical protein